MSAPRPDTDNVQQTVEQETNLSWSVTVDVPDHLTLVSGPYKLEVVWSGSYWTLELYDLSSSFGQNEPRWAQGPMHDANEVINAIPGFIPAEVRQ